MEEATGRMIHWPPLTDLRKKLAAGADRYTTMWKRGAQLGLETVVTKLLAELAMG